MLYTIYFYFIIYISNQTNLKIFFIAHIICEAVVMHTFYSTMFKKYKLTANTIV